jgi:hypothetical protein
MGWSACSLTNSSSAGGQLEQPSDVKSSTRTGAGACGALIVRAVGDIPVFRHNANRLVRTTIGGWEVSGIVTITSGLPINPQLTGGQSPNGLPNATNRPDQVGHVSYPHTVAEWFDTSAFVDPAAGAFGNAGHNSLRGPGRDNWNLSLFKSSRSTRQGAAALS